MERSSIRVGCYSISRGVKQSMEAVGVEVVHCLGFLWATFKLYNGCIRRNIYDVLVCRYLDSSWGVACVRY